jgi:hypothetical protein
MMKGNANAFDKKTYHFSMERALALMEGLRPRLTRAATAQLGR